MHANTFFFLSLFLLMFIRSDSFFWALTKSGFAENLHTVFALTNQKSLILISTCPSCGVRRKQKLNPCCLEWNQELSKVRSLMLGSGQNVPLQILPTIRNSCSLFLHSWHIQQLHFPQTLLKCKVTRFFTANQTLNCGIMTANGRFHQREKKSKYYQENTYHKNVFDIANCICNASTHCSLSLIHI